MMRMWFGVLVLGGAVILSSCGADDRAPVVRVAQHFLAAIQAGDGRQACSLLTDTARNSVTGATDASCSDVITGLRSGGSAVHDVQVWGDTAQVRIGGDVVFLRDLASGWRISAAGCTPLAHRPYDCDVQG